MTMQDGLVPAIALENLARKHNETLQEYAHFRNEMITYNNRLRSENAALRKELADTAKIRDELVETVLRQRRELNSRHISEKKARKARGGR
jgi:regulator of replication initiation timing